MLCHKSIHDHYTSSYWETPLVFKPPTPPASIEWLLHVNCKRSAIRQSMNSTPRSFYWETSCLTPRVLSDYFTTSVNNYCKRSAISQSMMSIPCSFYWETSCLYSPSIEWLLRHCCNDGWTMCASSKDSIATVSMNNMLQGRSLVNASNMKKRSDPLVICCIVSCNTLRHASNLLLLMIPLHLWIIIITKFVYILIIIIFDDYDMTWNLLDYCCCLIILWLFIH